MDPSSKKRQGKLQYTFICFVEIHITGDSIQVREIFFNRD